MKPRLVLVSGPWSCGSTAVTGALIHAGLVGFGPYFHTCDPLTPNSFEWLVFREWTMLFTSEQTLTLTATSPAVVRDAASRFRDDIVQQRYGAYDPESDPPLVMKYALSCLLLPALADVFDLNVVVVTRPLAAIEATALRRQWGAQFGAAGAQVIYAQLFALLVEHGVPAELLHFPTFQREPGVGLDGLLRACGHVPTQAQRDAALAFVRPS
jgi:hypothetical protein